MADEAFLSKVLVHLRMQTPFFGALSLFAQYRPTQTLPTMATDGLVIYYNPDFFNALNFAEQQGVILHELLHAALRHVPRRQYRDAERWNIAADIVVNGIVDTISAVQLMEGAIRYPPWADFSVEEIYELLLKDSPVALQLLPSWQDLNPPGLPSDEADEAHEVGKVGRADPAVLKGDGNSPAGIDFFSDQRDAKLTAHWQQALAQAEALAKLQPTQHGSFPAGLQREIDALNPATINWRAQLWRYLVRTPTDFAGFDRRFIGRRLYLDALEGESVQVYVAVDTSGSVDQDLLNKFLSEVMGILSTYPHLTGWLYYIDTKLDGPYPLLHSEELPVPTGGGGTSFIPFFAALQEQTLSLDTVAIYLTDGYGDFPGWKPDYPVLWVVSPGGLDTDRFPFGQVVRLVG